MSACLCACVWMCLCVDSFIAIFYHTRLSTSTLQSSCGHCTFARLAMLVVWKCFHWQVTPVAPKASAWSDCNKSVKTVRNIKHLDFLKTTDTIALAVASLTLEVLGAKVNPTPSTLVFSFYWKFLLPDCTQTTLLWCFLFIQRCVCVFYQNYLEKNDWNKY